jgi:hypothetical protein
MGVCVYSVFVLFCVGSGLATGWSHLLVVLPSVYKIQISEFINCEWHRWGSLFRQGRRRRIDRWILIKLATYYSLNILHII